MAPLLPGAGARIPGPIGLDQNHSGRDTSFTSHASSLPQYPNRSHSPQFQPAKGLQIIGPYPRTVVTEGYVEGKPGQRAFARASESLQLETYKSFANGHTHTDIYLAPSPSSGEGAYEMSLPSNLEKFNFGGRMHHRIPAGSKVFASAIPFKKGCYDTTQYKAEIDAIKKAHPDAALFVRVHGVRDQRVEVLGFDPSTAAVATTPRVGREVVHMYSNSAYSSFQLGTLAPSSEMPSEYRGKRFGGIEEVSHHSDRTYAKTVASRIEGFVGQEMALKISAWNNTEREVMIVPTTASRVVSGFEVGSSGASQFHYLDKIQNVTSVSIPLKAGETLRADHPDLARHIAEHPGALHMCRLHTDFAAPGKPSRIEVVSVE